MSKGTLKVKCTGLHESGKGIVKIKGKEYLVPRLLAGETAIVEMKRTKYKTFVNLVKVENESKDRVKPPCIYYGECGGCQLQHMSQEAQDQFKQKLVENLLKPFGKVNPILSMKEPYYYRNKVHSTFAYGKRKRLYRVFTKKIAIMWLM